MGLMSERFQDCACLSLCYGELTDIRGVGVQPNRFIDTDGGSKISHLKFAWLELTGKCQLECVHCYADSGTKGQHSPMSVAEWCRIINEIVALDAKQIQFIGGEPTLHPALPELVGHALKSAIEVEVFSNLVHVTPALWELFTQPGIRLACSYYSDSSQQHAAITGRAGSHARTKANIAEAVRRNIPLRAGVIDLADDQRSAQAITELTELGIPDVGVDMLRQVGRGVSDTAASMDQLCGKCGNGSIAIGPKGDVWPCVFSRWLPVGNAREASLAAILASPTMANTQKRLDKNFASRPATRACLPETMCDPQCGPSCSPACRPAGNCRPVGACAPDYFRRL
jgi:MoaA/NifB/PqqE/SkfB family radical SAM enzyme